MASNISELSYAEMNYIAKQIFDNFSYKPEWKFRYEVNLNTLHFIVYAKADMLDVNSSIGQRVGIQYWETLNLSELRKALFEYQVLNLIHSVIQKIESHEIDEHCTYFGERIFNPHDPEVQESKFKMNLTIAHAQRDIRSKRRVYMDGKEITSVADFEFR